MPKVKIYESRAVVFDCPGCHYKHYINIAPEKGRPCWTFNGNLDSPTLAPSILDRCGHYVPGQPQPPHCHLCRDAQERGCKSACTVCHFFLRDGVLEFLTDCTHALAGKKYPLPDLVDSPKPE